MATTISTELKLVPVVVGLIVGIVIGRSTEYYTCLLYTSKADFFLNLEAMDNSIAIALQVLRFIGENYDDCLLYTS